MKDEEFKDIVDGLLKDKGRVWKPEDIEEYLKSYEIDNETLIKILEYLSDDYIFRWLDFIAGKLPRIVSEKEFVSLLKRIILKIKGDFAQGPFIRTLINIGVEHPDLGISLYERMIAEQDADLSFYSCFPLGGAGKKEFDQAYLLMKRGLEGKNHHLKAASIRALRVSFESEAMLKKPSEIFEILGRLSSENEDMIVQIEVLNAYLDFSRFEPDVCIQQLFDIAKRESSVIRYNLANALWLRNLPRKEDEISLLEICAEDQDNNVLSRVSLALSKKGQEFPERALNIIKNWIRRGKYLDVREIEYSISEIGKAHLDRCIKEVEMWIEDESKDVRLRFFIPKVLTELSSGNYRQLIDAAQGWASRSEVFWKMALSVIREVLTQVFPAGRDESLVDTCLSTLKKMAEGKHVDVETTIFGEQDKFFQCFRLIEELEIERQQLSYERISENLKKYPTMRDFLGERWLKTIEETRNRTHPLLIFLSELYTSEKKLSTEVGKLEKETNEWARYIRSLRIREMLRPSAFLRYLEGLLKPLVYKDGELRNLRNGIRNENQFWETVSEVEIISAFMANYDVKIAPAVNGKKFDAGVKLNGKNLLFEVINPQMFKPLRYLNGKAFGIKNRARDKIYDEFKNHLQGMKTKEDPVVVVIDIQRSEISYDFVEDYLIGTFQLTMLFDKEKGEVVKTFPSRAEDSMHVLNRETDVLSAVICYKRYLGKDGNFHVEGRIIPNKHAKNPLDPQMIEKIEKALFR